MEEVSPVFNVDKIKKPLFVVQGANDPRVNIDESDKIGPAASDSAVIKIPLNSGSKFVHNDAKSIR